MKGISHPPPEQLGAAGTQQQSQDEETFAPVARVEAYLAHVREEEAHNTGAVQSARATIAQLEAERDRLAEDLGERSQELTLIRDEYTHDLKVRGEKVAELTDTMLRDKFGAQLDEMRSQLKSQYEERIRALEASLSDRETAEKAAKETVATFKSERDQRREQMEAQLNERIELLESSVKERDELLGHANESLGTLQQELEQSRSTAASELHALKDATAAERQLYLEELNQRHAADRETLEHQIKETRADVISQYEDRLRQFETTLVERDKLLERANDTIAGLQTEIDRAKETRSGERSEHQELIDAAKIDCAELTHQVAELQTVISDSDDIQRLKELEEERHDIDQHARALEGRVKGLTDSLAILQEICERSAAARSIIAGAGSDVDLDHLFRVLE